MVGIVFNFRGLEDGKAYRRGHTRPNSLRCHLLELGILPASCLAIGIEPYDATVQNTPRSQPPSAALILQVRTSQNYRGVV